MRICMLARSTRFHSKGGMEDHIAMLTEGLARLGHEIELITTSLPSGEQEKQVRFGKGKITLHFLEGTDPMHYSQKWFGKTAAKFTELNSKNPFDVVHGQSAAAFYIIKSGAARGMGMPVVSSLHGTIYDEIKTQLNLLSNPPSSLADLSDTLIAPLKIAKYLHSLHFMDRQYISGSDAIIATSDQQAQTIKSRFRVPQEKLFLVYNGIDERQFSPRKPDGALLARHGIPAGSFLVLCAARLLKEKGVQNAISILPKLRSRVPNAHLLVLGDGPYRRELLSLAKKLGVQENVSFAGFVPFDSLPSYFSSCSVFVNATIRQDGYDLTVLEAMGCGRPVVASNIGSMPTAISDQKDGVLVAPGDRRALLSSILLIANDRALAKRISLAARRKVERKFSQSSMVRQTLSVYRAAIGKSGIRIAAGK